MADDTEAPVLTERRDGVLLVTLNRSRARNAVNEALAHALGRAMDELDDTDDLRVGVLTGAGGAFCAGMDLKAFVAGETPWVEGRGFAGITQRAARKPLIAAVEGFALAGGFEIVLSCDLVVAASDARFGIPEVKRGLFAAAGALIRLPKRIPYHLAMELALTGDFIDAPRAAQLGVVNRVTDSGGALDGALELAGKVKANAPLALDASKQIVSETLDLTEARAWELQGDFREVIFDSADAQEGARAFAEKREPVWQGR
jgi:enoyl-CoA hydratase